MIRNYSSKTTARTETDRNHGMLADIFYLAQQIGRGEVTPTAGRDKLVNSHGFNCNSANMSIRSLRHLLNGERYRRALTLDAPDYFLRRIGEEYGNQACALL
jgi:hypothetical protein